MAATEADARPNRAGGLASPRGLGILLASVASSALPLARAETVPERGFVSFKYLDYADWQPHQARLRVRAPSLMVMAPIAGEWSVTGALTADTVSGASPSHHTADFGRMKDLRRARDLGVTRYFQDATLTLRAGVSRESDYVSRNLSLQGSFSSEDRNTTWHWGVAGSSDRITPGFQGAPEERKRVAELLAGITQALTQRDIAQLNLVYSRGNGYYSDPYKMFDNRPRERDIGSVTMRWNHHFESFDATSRLSYRHFADSFGIRAHTLGVELVKRLPFGWTLTPSARIHTQTRADFYVEVDPLSAPFPTMPPPGSVYYTEDQRMSAFGARSFALKVSKQITPDWEADIRFERYEQRSHWTLSGKGSVGLAPLSARSIQIGITRYF